MDPAELQVLMEVDMSGEPDSAGKVVRTGPLESAYR